MAVYESTRTEAGIVARTGHMIASIVASVAAWNDARVTRNALAALSDRELEDIGLCRGDIDLVVTRR